MLLYEKCTSDSNKKKYTKEIKMAKSLKNILQFLKKQVVNNKTCLRLHFKIIAGKKMKRFYDR